MKAFNFTIISVVIITSVFIHVREAEINRLKSKETVSEIEMNLLKDQIADMVSQGTYLEGFADGVISSDVSGYKDGYHAAIRQFSPKRLITTK